MSTFGGDSWAREAQYRKRRVDDLLIDGVDDSSFKKLSNGKFSCLVCPHRPILDSSLMLAVHGKGSRHLAALSKLKEKESWKQNENNKRIALSNDTNVGPCTANQNKPRLLSKPLIEQTRKAVSEILHTTNDPQSLKKENNDLKAGCSYPGASEAYYSSGSSLPVGVGAIMVSSQQQVDFRQQRERELKFTASGWKRDCHGRWYRDENVEFDSDEEDPNVALA